MASQDSSPAPDDGQQPDPEGQRIRSLDERFAAQDGRIDDLGGKLDKVLAAVTGGGTGPKAPTAGSAPRSDDSGGGLSVADQIRRGVEEIEARKQREAAEQAERDKDAAWRQTVEARLPEQRPAEPAPTRKGKLQRVLFGKP